MCLYRASSPDQILGPILALVLAPSPLALPAAIPHQLSLMSLFFSKFLRSISSRSQPRGNWKIKCQENSKITSIFPWMRLKKQEPGFGEISLSRDLRLCPPLTSSLSWNFKYSPGWLILYKNKGGGGTRSPEMKISSLGWVLPNWASLFWTHW